MLVRLYIKNLAIIEELQIEFDRGFNVFTGQTGAGKSLIIGALGLLLGFKQTSSTVRPQASEALLSAVFDLQNSQLIDELAKIVDIPIEEGELIVQRRFFPSGKTSASLNAVPVPVQTLKQIGELLVDVHGQHENQSLLKPAVQTHLLDLFAGAERLAEDFGRLHQTWRDAIRRRQELLEHQELRRQQLELYEFQLQEIDQADLKPGERETLETEHRQLSNVEKLQELTDQLIQGLEESDFPVLDKLRAMYSRARQLAQIDSRLKDVPGQFDSAIVELDDVAKALARYVDQLESDPARLSELDERMALLVRLANKYGHGDTEAVLTYRQEISEKLEDLRNLQSDFEAIDQLIEQSAKERQILGKKLADRRKKAASKLIVQVNKQLADLAMPNARFEVEFLSVPEESPSPMGLEAVEFMIRTNPGQPVLPIRKIASAGELSRITLGIKSILAGPDRSSVLVFDEVDSNVGGRLGEVIGTKIAKLSTSRQVICISHLPQIAAFADRHFIVRKQSTKTDTLSSIHVVSGEERVREIAEMISGKHLSKTTLHQAQEMLDHCGKS